MGFNCLKAKATLKRQFTFNHLSSQELLVLMLSTLDGWMPQSTSGPPCGLNMGPQDQDFSTLPLALINLPRISGSLEEKSKLLPCSASVAMRKLSRIHKKGHKVFWFFFVCYFLFFHQMIAPSNYEKCFCFI